MEQTTLCLEGKQLPLFSCQTAVVGSGAAGYHAAIRLKRLGVKDTLLVTEGRLCGTSRNTGSDKQTYYKLNLSGDMADSPADMARELFAGKCVDGDHALVEAALSARCFYHLCELGVPFPTNRYGEFVGYKTDHDPRARATSAGPLTSKLMTEALEAEAGRIGVEVLDGFAVIRILRDETQVIGLVLLERKSGNVALLRAKNVIFATGGPAGMYADSVYPHGHSGATGLAFAAGALGKNLTEWQFGLASLNPRWNVSGTYMQVLPRFFSVGSDGVEHEFLADYFDDPGQCLTNVFLKGYQWPFDCRKVLGGSSIIDLLVYRETALYGRRVYLDFQRNPYDLPAVPVDKLSPEARQYLVSAGATEGTPIERLAHMNQPAIDLYREKGVDLEKEPLEIALCAQHNNGGIDVDCWWQTRLPGFFVVGEAAGTHGVYRPGGSALNAGQVGSLRAAQYIAARRQGEVLDPDRFAQLAAPVVREIAEMNVRLLKNADTVGVKTEAATVRMSHLGGAIRVKDQLREALDATKQDLTHFSETVGVSAPSKLWRAWRLWDILTAQQVYLFAFLDYLKAGGASRGSSLCGAKNGQKPEHLEELFRFQLDDGTHDASVQLIELTSQGPKAIWRQVRPLPEGGGFFENVWRGYRENGNID